MTTREPSAPLDRIDDPGFTPGRRDIAVLLGALGDRERGDAVLRALVRAGEAAIGPAITGYDASDPTARPRLCELVGRFAAADPSRATWLVARLHDADERVRRRAATAIGKLEDPQHEAPLVAAWPTATSDTERKAIAAALGQCGGERSLALLDAVQTDDPELVRVVGLARRKLERTRLRSESTEIDLDRAPPSPVVIDLEVRAGLEPWVTDRLTGATQAGRGVVRLEWADTLRQLYAVRTFVGVSFPLPTEPIRQTSTEIVEGAIVRALASEQALAILSTFTRGPIRWRLAWSGQGHHRAATWRIVEALALVRPELVNDSRNAPWQAHVALGRRGVEVSLQPRGLVDPRFSWRRGSVPASSHPTIAAALAEAAHVRADDVVWDPFVGAGAELVECLRGAPARLLGTDLDPAAIAVARSNLDAAGAEHAELMVADACRWRPPVPPSLIISNPPMGHRVRGEASIATLLGRALDHWATVAAPNARVVWLSPVPDQTASHPAFDVRQRMPVDLGGLAAEFQHLAFVGRTRRK